MGSLLYEEFKTGRADRVFIAYTDFKNALVQIPTITQLLPIIHEADLPKVLAEQNDRTELEEPRILFEPDAPTLLDTLLPRLLETQVYQSLLESAASEQSARNTAMHNATDNATNMLNDLTLTFNQARQAMITREISEISAGKSALE
jgi:F-type H+-transporting ATPase subunit gamma